MFENVFDDFEIEDVKIEKCGDCVEEVDELDEIEIMRESIGSRCEKYDMSEFKEVKVILEIKSDGNEQGE